MTPVVKMRRKRSATDSTYGHVLVQSTIDNITWAAKEAGSQLKKDTRPEGSLRQKRKPLFATCDQYDFDVFIGIGRILEMLERLSFSRHMMRSFPQRSQYEKAGISHAAWLEYHYSFFVISLSSLSDLALQLTNSAFRLGLRPRDCTANVIKENNWVRPTAVRKALDRLEDAVKVYRQLKNKQVHHGEAPDLADFIHSDLYHRLKAISFLHMQGKTVVPEAMLKAAYRMELQGILSKLDGEIKAATAAIEEFFDALLPIYQGTEKALHQNPDKNCGRMRAAKAISET